MCLAAEGWSVTRETCKRKEDPGQEEAAASALSRLQQPLEWQAVA